MKSFEKKTGKSCQVNINLEKHLSYHDVIQNFKGCYLQVLLFKTNQEIFSIEKKRVNYDIPFPRLNRTPPRISLWPSLSWSQTVNSRDRSQRASKEISSHAMVCSHFGQTVLRQTPVFCLPPLAFSGNKYLQWIK